jgi:hypothetical protein
MFVMHPNILFGLSCQKRDDRNTYSFHLGYGWIKGNTTTSIEEPLQPSQQDEETGDGGGLLDNETQNNIESTTPNTSTASDASSKTKWFCHICALIYTILFLPVPFSRVYLHDHYRDQVLIGAVIGIAVSTLCYLGLMRGLGLYGKMSKFANGEWGKWWGVKSGWDWGFL